MSRTAASLIIPLATIAAAAPAAAATSKPTRSNPITHVIVIMQENRSFDHYFGAFPKVNGIPANTCVPLNPADPALGCSPPFHSLLDVDFTGPHRAADAQADIDDGISSAKMDGFIYQQTSAGGATRPTRPPTSINTYGVMGYHTAAEIPNYWAYAQHFVLQDAMFEGIRGWSVSSHHDLVSEWSANCTNPQLASTCTSTNDIHSPRPDTVYPWVSLFQLLDVHRVSWKYYLGQGLEPDCDDGEMTCAPEPQRGGVPSLWNPAPYFAWVKSQGSAYLQQHNPPVDQFLADIKSNTLPKVSWIIPSYQYSEHPTIGITAGADYVTSLVNAVMQSRYWKNTAIFIAWDDWGGFYDHVVPPNVDTNDSTTPIQGFGLRVPGLLISAYAKPGKIDRSVLSFDSYATFIEDLFLKRARLKPAKLGNPDSRPDLRDALRTVTYWNGTTAHIGNLMDEFDFTAAPLPPLVLSASIPSSLVVICPNGNKQNAIKCGATPVTISWDSIAGPDVTGPYTYHILRDGEELPQCTGTANSCPDTPPPGTHLYNAYSVSPQNVTSPVSPAAQLILGDQ